MKALLGKVWRIACLSGLAFLWILNFVFPNFANAYVANDMGDGVIELTTRSDQGFIISDITRPMSNKDKARKVFFCVSERKGGPEKCFYGSDREFKGIRVGDRLLGLQYDLSERIHNNKKQIAIGSGKYFYSLRVLRPAAQ